MAQRVRRGFQHFLGDKLPERLSDELMLRYYKLLRHSKNLHTKEVARYKIIMNHVRLGFAHATRFASGRPNQVDEIVSEMLDALIDGVDRIADGAIDHHVGTPNMSGYLVSTMTGRMRKYITRQRPIILLPEARLRRATSKGYEASPDLREILKFSVQTEREQKILDLCVAGHNDRQIGEMLSPAMTSQRVNQIRLSIRKRALEYMKC